ncbi:MAG: carboxypeptidase regulatory-like domain-containing protein [Planctomycetota bacterium]|nr:carboxypeptidase regulatory-like domain-containing protein [Planctomycetota bacterium]
MLRSATFVGLLSVALVFGFLAIEGCTGSGDDGSGNNSVKSEASKATAAPVDEYANVDKATAGTITGKVMFTGTKPAAEKLKLDSDEQCEAMAGGEDVFQEHDMVNDNGTLGNVVVFIKSGVGNVKFPVPNTPVVLDQKGCRYDPHVFGVRAGQDIKILNSDDTLHNINAKPDSNKSFNAAMPKKGMEVTKKFKNPEVGIYMKCEVHPWMNAWVSVFDHPYFDVTGEAGTFELKNVPAGEYTLEAYHERWGKVEQKVKVDAGGTATADFTFDGKEDKLRHKTVYKRK